MAGFDNLKGYFQPKSLHDLHQRQKWIQSSSSRWKCRNFAFSWARRRGQLGTQLLIIKIFSSFLSPETPTLNPSSSLLANIPNSINCPTAIPTSHLKDVFSVPWLLSQISRHFLQFIHHKHFSMGVPAPPALTTSL